MEAFAVRGDHWNPARSSVLVALAGIVTVQLLAPAKESSPNREGHHGRAIPWGDARQARRHTKLLGPWAGSRAVAGVRCCLPCRAVMEPRGL